MKSRAEYMRKYRKEQKPKECCNEYCDQKAEFFEQGFGYCLVHFLLIKHGGKNG